MAELYDIGFKLGSANFLIFYCNAVIAKKPVDFVTPRKKSKEVLLLIFSILPQQIESYVKTLPSIDHCSYYASLRENMKNLIVSGLKARELLQRSKTTELTDTETIIADENRHPATTEEEVNKRASKYQGRRD
jgi:hypothetical protein